MRGEEYSQANRAMQVPRISISALDECKLSTLLGADGNSWAPGERSRGHGVQCSNRAAAGVHPQHLPRRRRAKRQPPLSLLGGDELCFTLTRVRMRGSMAATPKKLVHWALDASLSELASPFSDASTSDSYSSTSSLQYLNSQLLAHGFTHGSGLSFEGLAKEDAEKAVKCILGMLSQRIVRVRSQ